MEEEQSSRKRLHIRKGWLIIFIIIIIILFKVDIKSKIESEQFQDNLSYIEDFFENIWDEYIADNFKEWIENLSDKLVDSSVESFQEIVNEKLDSLKSD